MRTICTALAAVAGLCATAGRLEAAPFSIFIGAITGADGSGNFTLTGDTSSSLASLKYYENNQDSDFISFISTSFLDSSAQYARSGITTTLDPSGSTKAVDFTVFDPAFSYTASSTNGTSQVLTGYTLAFTLLERLAPDGTLNQFDAAFTGNTLLGSKFENDLAIVTVTGDPLAPVPLPMSAPLFGAALLTLAGLGRLAPSRPSRS